MTSTEPQGMTSERLDEIQALVDDVESARSKLTGLVIGDSQLRGDRPRAPMLAACHDLLADNERLRAREAALVAVVRAVASSDGHMARLWDGTPAGYMLLPEHEGIIEQARALLASAGDGEAEAGEKREGA